MDYIRRIFQNKKTKLIVRILVVLAIFALLAIERTFWTPDVLFIMLLALFFVFGQTRAFIIRFAPLIILLIVYEGFRSFIPHLNSHVHYSEMINFDKWLGGGVLPTTHLQNLLWHGNVRWYDFYFYFLYTVHFLMPIILGVVIWKKFGDRNYWQFMVALLTLSYGAFLTYLLFPAAPPWMASDMHLIEPIRRISSDVWWAMGIKDFSSLYANLSPNPVAAVPSLHCAYPTLFALFVVRLFKAKKFWLVWLYPISISLGVVYLGEHYVFDVILGIIFALIAFYSTDAFFKWQTKKHWSMFDKIKARLRK